MPSRLYTIWDTDSVYRFWISQHSINANLFGDERHSCGQSDHRRLAHAIISSQMTMSQRVKDWNSKCRSYQIINQQTWYQVVIRCSDTSQVSWTESWRSTPYATLQDPTNDPVSSRTTQVRDANPHSANHRTMMEGMQDSTSWMLHGWQIALDFLSCRMKLWRTRVLHLAPTTGPLLDAEVGPPRSNRVEILKEDATLEIVAATSYASRSWTTHNFSDFWKVTRWLAFGLEGQNQSTGVKFLTGYKDIMRRLES